jgi:glycerol-3-phosphate acyltransferase PlsY
MIWRLILCAIMGYLFGTLNGAIVISKLTKHEDVREKGSGNAGLTNFLRSYGGASTLLVVLIDMGKMVAACLLATLIYTDDTDTDVVNIFYELHNKLLVVLIFVCRMTAELLKNI